jgi:hypothetical protein
MFGWHKRRTKKKKGKLFSANVHFKKSGSDFGVFLLGFHTVFIVFCYLDLRRGVDF